MFRFLPAIVFSLLLEGPVATSGVMSVKRPNVVFILVDDLRNDVFGYMNHPFVETLNIDALAMGGMQFENAFVTTSLCSPARASFLTGRYMHNHKVVDNADKMPEGTVTFPMLFQQAEYETAFIGKWHMGGSSDAVRPGFDHWVSFRGQGSYFPEGKNLNINGRSVPQQKYMTDELTDHAISWLDNRGREKPFLLYLSHKGVHGFYDPAPRHLGHYSDETYIPYSEKVSIDGMDKLKPMWVHDQRNSWHGIEFPYHGLAEQTVAEMYRRYCEMVLSVDESVGRVLTALKRLEIKDDTLIIFTSDGGHLWGEHGLIDKRCAYEASIRIPLLFHWPKAIKPGSICSAIATNIDVAPTLLALAGIPIPAEVDGSSLRKFLFEPGSVDERPPFVYEYYWDPSFPHTPTTFAVRKERFKLIQYHGIWDTDELYDLEADPQENTNLIFEPAYKDRVEELREILYQRLLQTRGLSIRLGRKRDHGQNLRSSTNSKRSSFPSHMISMPSEDR